MKTIYQQLIFTFLILMSFNSSAAEKGGFSCEKIKDKAVRASCISDREDMERMKKEKELEKVKLDELEKAKIEESLRLQAIAQVEKKLVDAFVLKSKEELVKDFKDPLSSQYMGVFIAHHDQPKYELLCGSINSKNSYGGYIGFKKFIVTWKGEKLIETWVQENNTLYDVRRDLDRRLGSYDDEKAKLSELRIFKDQCENGTFSKTVKVES